MANVIRGKIKKADDHDPMDYMMADENDEKKAKPKEKPFSLDERKKQISKVQKTRKDIMAELFED